MRRLRPCFATRTSVPPVCRIPTARSPSSSHRDACAKRLGSSTGVRQGQPLGALLGYRVERLLHETVVDNGRSLDRFIAPLRRVAPLVARSSGATTGPVEAIAANNVVDGLVLNRRWKEERSRRARGAEHGRHGHERSDDAHVDPRHACRRDRRAGRRAHRRVGVSDGPRQHVAHGRHARRHRARRCAAAGARGRTHAAIGHVAHASRAAPDERTEPQYARLVGRGCGRALGGREDAQLLGLHAARRRHARFAARSSASTTRPAQWSRRVRCP